MKPFTADLSNLDQVSRDYLRAVAKHKGRGSPGVYVPGKFTIYPFVSFFAGGIVLLFGLAIAFSSLKAPWATAMLVTATLLLGVWLMLYPFRRAFGGGLGKFQYFDPNHAFEVNGREVTVTHLAELTHLDTQEIFASGNYQQTKLNFKLPGQARTVSVANRSRAGFVANYYANVITLREENSNRDDAEQGAMAKYITTEGDRPGDMKLLDLDIREVPAESSATKNVGFAFRGVIILGITAAIFVGSWMLLSPLQDDIVFHQARDHGVQGYRDYLLDERHTAHRDEAKAKIAELYEPLIQRVAQCPDPNERQGWTEMLQSLSQFEGLPAVSIAVTEEGEKQPDSASQTRMWLADSLGSHFGPQYLAFVEPPQGVKPHLEIVTRNDAGMVRWQAKFRRTPESEPLVGKEHTAASVNAASFVAPPQAFKNAFFTQTFGTPPPAIYTEPTGGGDFDE